MPETEEEVKKGDVFKWDPPEYHCHEGMAVAEEIGGRIVLLDTYWNIGFSDRVEATGKLEFLFNLEDYQPINEALWVRYHPDDRQIITSHHGIIRHCFVRKGATEDLDTRILNARNDVAKAEQELAGAQHILERTQRRLQDLEKQKKGKP